MYSKIKILGHPVHPMLVSFPIAFYTSTLVCFIVYAVNDNPFWFRAGFASNAAGVVMALVAAIPGFIDWSLGIPNGTLAKRDGLIHMSLNVTALLLFAITLWLNSGQWTNVLPEARFAILLPALGILATLGAGYMGWTLVQTHHVGVQVADMEDCAQQCSEERRRRAA